MFGIFHFSFSHFHLLGVQYITLPAGGYNSFHMLLPVLVRRCFTLFCAKYLIIWEPQSYSLLRMSDDANSYGESRQNRLS